VVVDGKKVILHTIPSGILHTGTLNMIGNGVVVDLEAILEEIDKLGGNANPGALKISKNAHALLPYHKALERIRSTSKKIDTTKRGIGPCYTDKIAREGIPLGDFLRPEIADPRMIEKIAAYNLLAIEFNKIAEEQNTKQSHDPVEYAQVFDAMQVLKATYERFEKLRPYLDDTGSRVRSMLREGSGVLLEGAQGTLLDVDHGTYPYVTSSNTTAGGACTGAGIGPRDIGEVVGILKAYTTRVGEGPFPTELDYRADEIGKRLQATGAEFGATTGRPRRVGWLDLVAAQYAVGINSISEIALTKLDVLDDLPEIKVCVAYEIKGTRTTQFDPLDLMDIVPVYETLPGWKTPTTQCTTWEDLPENAKKYVKFIEEKLVPIRIISVGNDRKQTVYRGAA
jgi:adenylosuccinate synthase